MNEFNRPDIYAPSGLSGDQHVWLSFEFARHDQLLLVATGKLHRRQTQVSGRTSYSLTPRAAVSDTVFQFSQPRRLNRGLVCKPNKKFSRIVRSNKSPSCWRSS